MHILLSSAYALPVKGGVQVVCEYLAQMWYEAGHQVTHITSDTDQPEGVVRPWRRIYLPAWNPVDPYIIPFPLFNPVHLRRVYRKLLTSVDVVNVQGILYHNNLALVGEAQHADVPVVLTEYPGIVPYHNPLINWLEARAFDTLGRYTARHSDYFVYHNQEVEASLRHYFCTDTPSQQIKVGVDTAHFHPVSDDERARLRQQWGFDKPTVLFAGRRTPRKGTDWLPLLDHPDFDIVICGARQTALDSANSRVLGYVSDAELLSLYQACDAFLMFTSGRDFPLVGLEAMACGLPVVLFENPANREYHSDETAVFVEAHADAILAGLLDLIGNPQQRQQMARHARQRAETLFDWGTISQQYLSIFKQLRI
ncbi:MAG: glycosyltransferase family 4 protein [Anaerolineae bacterium]